MTRISRLTSLADRLDEMAAAQVSGADLSALAQQIRDDNAELLAASTPPSAPEPAPEPTPEPAPDA